MIFHRDIGFPSTFRAPVGAWPTMPSKHARDRAGEKGFTIPEKIDMRYWRVIEAELIGSKITKLVLRGAYDRNNDLCVVVIPQGLAYFVKTAWLNSTTDTHRTLDVTAYAKP